VPSVAGDVLVHDCQGIAMAQRIEDYALIGDCQTAALVGRDASIDWLCLPRFDSPACFAALLGGRDHGRWQIAPSNQVHSSRRQYLGQTLVLETEFTTDTGVVAVIDFMPIRDKIPDVVRIVEGRRGTVPMKMELDIRHDYGSIVPWVRKTKYGISAVAGPDSLRLLTRVPTHGENLSTVADFSVAAGERVPFILDWHRSYLRAPKAPDAERTLADTLAWWEDWAGRCRYDGAHRELVVRSLITLKAMTYAPSGGIVAAPTTSLPEHLGGVRNWDYRYCWLRDATLSLLALLNCGYSNEARAWREWLLRAVAGDPAKLQIMYGVSGERRLDEYEVLWLPGYENSRPVRIGNAASRQFQLDVYGEVADALHMARTAGLKLAPAGWHLEKVLIDFVEKAWNDPDEGIWEVRGPRQHFTHSKVMAWVALDRAIKSAERWRLDAPLERWRAVRATIHERVCHEGFNKRLNTFVQSFRSEYLDASVLMIPLVGFLPASDPRVRGTVAAIEQRLMRDGFVLRYDTRSTDDGLPEGEGAFLACSFWLADNYVLAGERDKAERLFEHLTGLCNDVGLLSEEFDPVAKRLVGNFPQGFSHIGLINTALNLHRPAAGPAEQRKNP
jgi:GH15 family glucan-1,4-alpha-glucosidase